ncbi:immunoglobulin-like domain-containing protein, partial [Paenibacillus sp. VTT E-133291]
MKRSLSLLMALIILFVSLPAAKALEVPYSLSPSEFINASVPGARALAYHEGYIYAAQRDPGGIYRISVETGEVTKVLDREYVMTVALNQAGDLFFTTDNYDRNIYKINKSALVNFPLPSNSGTAYYNTGFNFVYGMAFDATDNLYFTDYTSKGIYKLTPGATSATSVIKGLPTAVQGITISSAGHLYAIEDYNNNIYRINSDHLLNSTVAESEFELLLNMRTIPNGIAYLPNGKAYISYGSQVFQSPELGENDTEKPVITLNGASTLLVRNGTSFSDPGVSVSDNVEIDLTAKVTYSLNNVELPTIDTTVAGRYTIRYDATDTAGNAAVAVKRTIIVNEDSTNLAYGVPVTVDKGTASGQTGHLTDDLLETGWIGSQSDAPWTITLDMSAGAAYNEIRVVDTVYLQSYEVKVSDSVTGPFETVTGTTYASLVHTDGQYNGFTTDSVFFPEEISKRYIQIVIYVVGEDGSTGPDLQEIKVFNQPIIPTPTATPTSTPTATPTPTPIPTPIPTPTPTPTPT